MRRKKRKPKSLGGAGKKQVLLTSVKIREGLGPTYMMLRKNYDPLNVERPKTNTVGKNVFERKKDVCVACGRRQKGTGLRIEAAHIIPLEEGGGTSTDNIVPLCRREGRGENLGCHQLFDAGCCSVSEMQNAKRAWKGGKSKYELRNKMRERYRKHQRQPSNIGSNKMDRIQALLTQGHTAKALKEAKKELEGMKDKKERLRLRYKIVEIERRRSEKGALERAAKLHEAIAKEKGRPRDLESWFYYEGGYVRLLLGQHNVARKQFQRSLRAVEKSKRGWEGKWVSSAVLAVQCTVALDRKKADYDKLRKKLEKAEQVARQALELHGKRWVASCLWHLVMVDLLRGDRKSAEKSLKKAKEHWHSMNVLEGWDKGFRPSILAITGGLLAEKARTKAKAEDALRYLARALVLLVGARGRQPERVRDVLYAIGKMLPLVGKKSHAKRVIDVGSHARDGSSWRYPYRDRSNTRN